MIKWGVIGAGGIAYRRTIPEGLLNARNAKLIAIQDLNVEIADKIGSEFGVNVYKTEREIMEDKNIDVVYIATPVYLHHNQCINAARHKKNIFCEKILCLSEKEGIEIIDECLKNNVKLGVGFNSLHLAIKEALRDNKIGKPIMARAQLSCWYPKIEGSWRQARKTGGGGSLTDMGSHCIDIIEFIFESKVKEVSCITANMVHDYEVEDTAIVTCRLDNGAFAIIDNCFNIPDNSSQNFLEIYGSKGSILCKKTIGQDSGGIAEFYIDQEQKEYNAGQKRIEDKSFGITDEKKENIYKAEVEYFSNCVENNVQPQISGELGLHQVRIIKACYESAKTKKIIEIN